MAKRARVLAVPIALAAMVMACGDEGPNTDACAPGDFKTVTLADGGAGWAQCTSDGGGYVAYDGDPTIPIDSSADAGPCDPSLGKLPYMCAGCTVSSDCADGLQCFPFNSKGPHCTQPCTSNADCPQPTKGCGQQKVCSPP